MIEELKEQLQDPFLSFRLLRSLHIPHESVLRVTADEPSCTVWGQFDGTSWAYGPVYEHMPEDPVHVGSTTDRLFGLTLKKITPLLKSLNYVGPIGMECVISPSGDVRVYRIRTKLTELNNGAMDSAMNGSYDAFRRLQVHRLIIGDETWRTTQNSAKRTPVR